MKKNNYKNDVTMFVYWCANSSFYDVHKIFQDIYGLVMGEHFYSKLRRFFDHHDCETSWILLYCEMTDDNRDLLLNWLRENY